MNRTDATAISIAILMIGLGFLSMLLPASGETWDNTSDEDFSEGETFFVEIDEGSLKLTRTLSKEWSVMGEAGGDNFGICVASAGDVNGDGYSDVIVGASGNDDGGSSAGKAYVFFGSLNGLSSTSDWDDTGEATYDYFGYSVAGAGDVNGDGYDDIIIGAYGNDEGPGDNAGKAYVYHGSSSGPSATPDWYDQGEADGDLYGFCVASAGDVNGDGYSDAIVGAYSNNNAGEYDGEAYVYHGSSTGLTQDADPDWSDQGEAGNDYFGYCVASAGDVNDDGYDDVIVGAYGHSGDINYNGKVYAYHGSSTGLSTTPDWTDEGEGSDDQFGRSLASAGDVNGDGYSDVIVGAYGNDTDQGTNFGKAYAYLGSGSGLSSTPDWTVAGEAESNNFGRSVSSAGDVNRDGYSDVIVGAERNDDGGTYAGKAYIYLGTCSGPSQNPCWTGEGESAGDFLGNDVSVAGDVNGDGYSDIIVGAHYNDDGGSNAGEVYLYQYLPNPSLELLDLGSDVGENDGDHLGSSVASGDINGDGYDDVIVGAYGVDVGVDNGVGRVYFYHGSENGIGTTPDSYVTGEEAGDSFGYKLACAGDVNADGYDDVIVGAYANDEEASYAGKVYCYHGSSSGIAQDADPDWEKTGEKYEDKLGTAVAGAGDVNGDGYDDVLLGAGNYDDGATDQAGKAYLYYGSLTGLSSSVDWSKTYGRENEQYGSDVAGVGDVNDDGYDDIIVGAGGYDGGGDLTGKAYAYYGSPGGLSGTADWDMTGEAAGDRFGSVGWVGDVTGDGYDDVVVGAYQNDDGPGSNTGKIYLYPGSSDGISETALVTRTGEATSQNFGSDLEGAGDLNGDGYNDVIVGAPGNDNPIWESGKVFVYLGSSTGLSVAPDWIRTGDASGNHFGRGLSSAGDVNGDGRTDMILGEHYWSASSDYEGRFDVYGGQGTFADSGVYDSEIFSLDSSRDQVNWQFLDWDPAIQTTGTEVKFQIGTSNGDGWVFKGPDGTASTYYTNTHEVLRKPQSGTYWRYRAYLFSNEEQAYTPQVDSVTIEYSTFTKPTVTLNWPNGGENLMHGEDYPVTWTTTGDVAASDPVALYYSLDNGTTWTAITTGTANDGIHVWTLPSDQDVERALVKVIVSAPDGSTVTDTSDRPFSIDPPPGQSGIGSDGNGVTSPAAGEEITSGSTVIVEWELIGEETVTLYYSTDFGQNWQIIAENILNLNSYQWEIPEDMTSDNVVIRVQGTEQNVVSNLFIISEEEARIQDGSRENSSDNFVVFEGMMALLIGLFVALVLVVRYWPDK